MVLRDRPLHQLQQLIGGVDVGVSQLKALDLDLIVTEVVGQPPNSSVPVTLGPALLHGAG